MRESGATDLGVLLMAVRAGLAAPASLYLVGGTSHLAQGWRGRVPHLELAGEPGAPESLEAAVREAAGSQGVGVVWESPADVVPLPDGWQERCRAVSPDVVDQSGMLRVAHFDPYSVVLRLVARGDEPDYVTALEYVRRGWVEPGRLEALHGQVVPRFTFRTLAQDPAEFRRKFSGLRQLVARDRAAGTPAEHVMADTGMSWL